MGPTPRRQNGKAGKYKIVVLDDDPTGIQTVHGCYLITHWDDETLEAALADVVDFFYILTNSRGKTQDEATSDIRDILSKILAVNYRYGYNLLFICRSDSTLRGHFPLEIECVAAVLERHRTIDGFFFIPAFFEAGRITKNNTHYMKMGAEYIPVDETEFARDSVFSYTTSHLPRYIEEKSRGRIKADTVARIGNLSETDGDTLAKQIQKIPKGAWTVVNAEDYTDLDRFSAAVYQCLGENKYYLFQSAASFVKSFSNTPDKGFIRRLGRKSAADGIVMVGSHVSKTTAQLVRLLEHPVTTGVELDIHSIVSAPETYLQQVMETIAGIHSDSLTPVIYTGRKEISGPDRIALGKRISSFLAAIVRQLPYRPSWLIAKGGITSHDILTQGLGVRYCRVRGQILPGVPVVTVNSTPNGTRFPFLIFPGNVGTVDSLLEAYTILVYGETP